MFEGVFAPIPTPFVDGEVSVAKLAENLARWNRTHLAGYVVLGSNGEAVFLTEGEREIILSAAREAIPEHKAFIAGAGAESTKVAMERIGTAAAAGADAVLLTNPTFFRGLMTTDNLRRHYFALADASPVPVLVYNVPKFTGVDLSAETILELAQHPNIVGLKDSGGNVTKLGAIIGAAPEGFEVLAGSGGFLYATLVLGGVGGVLALANVAPDPCYQIYEAFREGRHDRARELQLRMIPLNTALTAQFGVPGLKAALDLVGYYGGPPRSPLSPAKPEQLRELEDVLKRTGVLLHDK